MPIKLPIKYLDGEDFILQSKRAVATWYMKFTGRRVLTEQVRLVWYNKTLQDHKAILCVPGEPDNYMFEMVYNGLKSEAYLDAYEKLNNSKLSVVYTSNGDFHGFNYSETSNFGEIEVTKVPELDSFVVDNFTVKHITEEITYLELKYSNPYYIEKIANWMNDNVGVSGVFMYRGVWYTLQEIRVMEDLFDANGLCSTIRIIAQIRE